MATRNNASYWTRRDVMRGAATLAAAAPLRAALAASELWKQPRFAYVAAGPGMQPKGEDAGCIHVFKIAGGKWSRIQRVASRAPACLVLSHTQRTLYVANDIAEHAGLPRGTVEAFAVGSNGHLTSLGVQPMALSGTNPRALALSPDGRSLVVAAYGGGLYSLFPITSTGHLEPPKQNYKQVGSGPHAEWQRSAHPHTLLFDERSGRLITSDLGADRLNLFSIEDLGLQPQAQRSTIAGSGPGAIVLHSQSRTIFVAHELEGTVVSYRCDLKSAVIGPELQRVTGQRTGVPSLPGSSIALHASGNMLYSVRESEGFLTAWQVDAHSGRLGRTRTMKLSVSSPSQLVPSRDGSDLLIVDRRGIYRVKTDSLTGQVNTPEQVAVVENARHAAVTFA